MTFLDTIILDREKSLFCSKICGTNVLYERRIRKPVVLLALAVSLFARNWPPRNYLLVDSPLAFVAQILEQKRGCSQSTIFSKGVRFETKSILDMHVYISGPACHPPGVKREFVKREALRFPRTISSGTLFDEKIKEL